MYTSVLKELNCKRCGEPFVCALQFKYGHDVCEIFNVGDKHRGKVPPGKYFANSEELCPSCRRVRRGLEDMLRGKLFEYLDDEIKPKALYRMERFLYRKTGRHRFEGVGSLVGNQLCIDNHIPWFRRKIEPKIKRFWERQLSALGIKGIVLKTAFSFSLFPDPKTRKRKRFLRIYITLPEVHKVDSHEVVVTKSVIKAVRKRRSR